MDVAAREAAAIYVAALLRMLADARACQPDDLAHGDVVRIENLVLSAIRDGYDLAHDLPTVRTMIPPMLGK